MSESKAKEERKKEERVQVGIVTLKIMSDGTMDISPLPNSFDLCINIAAGLNRHIAMEHINMARNLAIKQNEELMAGKSTEATDGEPDLTPGKEANA